VAGPLKALVKSPFSMFSGYGNDGWGLVRALVAWGCDVYVQPTWLDVPVPKDLLHLLTKPLVAPFDLTINHWDPGNLAIQEPARRATGLAVAWTMWEFSAAPGPAEVMRWAPDGKSKVPVIVQPKKGGLYPLCQNRSTFAARMKWYDLLLAYDPVSLEALEPLLPRHVARGILIGGYDSENWRPVARDWHGDQFGFAMHGALNNRKQPYLVLQAHLELREEDEAYREQARLSFHTTTPPLFPELQEILNKDSDKRVRIYYDTWPDATLKEFYAAQHCLVYPSQGEGKNVPALEFMSTGGVVIHTKRGGPEMWLNEDIGYEVPFALRPVLPRYPDGAHSARVELADLKQVMLRVFRSRSEAQMKGELASRLIPQQLDWGVIVRDLFRRCRDLCGRQGEIVYSMAQECRREQSRSQ
jgi:hypothetical protein